MDDVLERAASYIARFDESGPFPSDGRDAREIIDTLAAEARAENERLKRDVEHYAKAIIWEGDMIVTQTRYEQVHARLRAENERLAAECEALRAALTPGASTKAEYIGEFTFPSSGTESAHINVPWTTIKEIMAAILSRAVREG